MNSITKAGPQKPSNPERDYYAGVDLGAKRDPSVVAVVLKEVAHYTLVHMKVFPLRTEYTAVLVYLKMVAERFRTVRRWSIDQTGVGEPFPELATKIGLKSVQGIELSLPKKQEIMTNMKQVMEQRRLSIPGNRELLGEIRGVIAELTAAGKTKFSHRSGTHDDRVWALALALYGGRFDLPHYKHTILTGKVIKDWWEYPSRQRTLPPRYQPINPLPRLSDYYLYSGMPIPWPPPRTRVGY